jgi:hypothetical protein
MTKHILRCRDDAITSLNTSKHGGRLQISRSDYLWRMWRRIGAWGPFSETNFTFCWCTPPISLKHSLQVYLQTLCNTVSECISEITQCWPQVHLPACSIMASKCISKLTPIQLANLFLTLVDHSLRVIVWVHLIFMFKHTSNCSQALPAHRPDMPCVGG